MRLSLIRQLATHCDFEAAKLSSSRVSKAQAILPVLLESATIVRLKPRLAANHFSHWERRSSCFVIERPIHVASSPTRAKMAAVVNRGDEHCCDHGPTPGNFERRPHASFERPIAKRSPVGWLETTAHRRARAARASAEHRSAWAGAWRPLRRHFIARRLSR